MAKRKSTIDMAAIGNAAEPEAPAFGQPSVFLSELIADILRCNTARKCHDRVRRALAELENLES